MEEEKKKQSATQIVKEIRRQTLSKFSAEEKIKMFWLKILSADEISRQF